MKPLLLYIVQVVICSGLLYSYYHFFLRNKSFHQYNRYYLLAATVISLLVPFLNIPVYFSEAEKDSSLVLQTLRFISSSSDNELVVEATEGQGQNWFTLQNISYVLYGLMLTALLVRFIISLVKIKKIIRQHPVERLGDIRFVNTEEKGTPFSFFRWLFWNRNIVLDSDKGQQVFRHELFHIRQKHSVDVVFLEIITMLLWINPFFHLIKKETKAIHEFLADEFAIHQTDKWEYAELLLMQALQTQHSIVNPFFHTQIKRRIAMITSSQQPRYRYLRKILVLPLFALVFFLFAFTYKQVKQENTATEVDYFSEKPVLTDTIPAGKNTFEVEVAGGSVTSDNKGEKITLIGDSIFFKPVKSGAEGKQPLYVVDGKIIKDAKNTLRQLSPSEVKSVTVLKGDAAKKAYNVNEAVEIWTKDAAKEPVEMKNNFLDEVVVEGMPIDASQRKELVTVIGRPTTEPFWVLNGKLFGKENPLDEYGIKPNDIESINVIKGDKAIALYGEGAKDGVIEITTKKKEPLTLKEVTVEGYPTKKSTIENKNIQEGEVKEVVVAGYQTKKDNLVSEDKKNNLDELKPIYPNPATNHFTIPFTAAEESTGIIYISDLNGRVLSQQNASIIKGKNNLNVSTAQLANGTYLVTLQIKGNSAPSSQQVYKLVKQ